MNSGDSAERVPPVETATTAERAGLIVRPFVEADRPVLRDIFVAARNAAFVWAPKTQHLLEDFDRVTDGERILVAQFHRQVVGFAAIWEADSFLHSLFVAPAFQRRGVGNALLAACAPFFLATPTLKCLRANTAALAFYQARGWSIAAEGDSPDGPYWLMESRLLAS